MRVFPVAVGATILLASVLAGDTRPGITESEFLESLEGEHPALVALGQSLAEARAAARGVRRLSNPELGASWETPGELQQLDVLVSWRPPHPARRRLALAAADAEVAAARSRLEAERVALRQAVREVFADWAMSTATAAALVRWTEELEGLANRERERAAVGEASGLDARRLALAASEARGRLARVEARRLEAFARVRVWRADLASDLVPELPPLIPPVAAMSGGHLELDALRSEHEVATAHRELASRVLDMPTLAAGWQRQEASGEVAQGATVGLSWVVPLFDRGQAERASTQARLEATRARLELAEREIQAGREGALGAYGGLRAAALAASSATAESTSIGAAATAAFQAGETSVTDLLDALRSATEAEIAALELYAEALAAHRRLEQLIRPPLGEPVSSRTPAPNAPSAPSRLSIFPSGDPS